MHILYSKFIDNGIFKKNKVKHAKQKANSDTMHKCVCR